MKKLPPSKPLSVSAMIQFVIADSPFEVYEGLRRARKDPARLLKILAVPRTEPPVIHETVIYRSGDPPPGFESARSATRSPSDADEPSRQPENAPRRQPGDRTATGSPTDVEAASPPLFEELDRDLLDKRRGW